MAAQTGRLVNVLLLLLSLALPFSLSLSTLTFTHTPFAVSFVRGINRWNNRRNGDRTGPDRTL
ncbi:hypothetical protein C7212DRAFT_338941, partial [Tuber magnatum]